MRYLIYILSIIAILLINNAYIFSQNNSDDENLIEADSDTNTDIPEDELGLEGIDGEKEDEGIPTEYLEAAGVNKNVNSTANNANTQTNNSQISGNDNNSKSSSLNIAGYMSSINAIKWGGKEKDEYEVALIRQRLHLESFYESFYFNARFEIDILSDMPWEKENIELQIGKAYFDVNLGDFIFRVGQQTVGWGKSVSGIFGVDMINPIDYRQFLLNDINELKIPVPMMKAEWHYKKVGFEALWIPIYIPNKYVKFGSIWYRNPLDMIPSGNSGFTPNININDTEYPDNNLKNSQAAAKFSANFLGIDMDLFYEYLFNHNPVMKKTISNVSMTNSPTIEINPKYEKMQAGGISLETPIWDFIFKADGLFMYNNYYNYPFEPGLIDLTDPTSLANLQNNVNEYNANEGLIKKHSIRYLAGVDYTYGSPLMLSVNYLQDIILDYDKRIVNDQYTNMLISFARSMWLKDTLSFEPWLMWDINNKATIVRFFVSYKLEDALNIIIGAEFFNGAKDSNFGYFSKNDLIELKFKYSF